MPSEPYDLADAERDLASVVSAAPVGAASGTWTATMVQAGTSSCQGGYLDSAGTLIDESDDRDGHVYDAIEAVMERLGTAGTLPHWNTLTVRWNPPARLVLTTSFDVMIVPRGPDDPIYEQAAHARRRFWQAVGTVQPGYLAEDRQVNAHNQTRWFGPHRRVVAVHRANSLVLATDGLSTPWAGIPDKENGVGCELCLELTDPSRVPNRGAELTALWGEFVRSMGDVIADDNSLPDDIEENGPVLSWKLGAEYAPFTRVVLSLHETSGTGPTRIAGLPFGDVRLLAATPLTEEDQAGLDFSDDMHLDAAHIALSRHAARTLPRRPWP